MTKRVVEYWKKEEGDNKSRLFTVHYEDEQGRRQGLYLQFERDGRMHTRVTYKDDVTHDIEYYYDADGLWEVLKYDENGVLVASHTATEWKKGRPDLEDMFLDDARTHEERRTKRQYKTVGGCQQELCDRCCVEMEEGETLTSIGCLVRDSRVGKHGFICAIKWKCKDCAKAFAPLVDENGLFIG